MIIQRIYEVDPLKCPKCGGTMKIISFIERGQADGKWKGDKRKGQRKGDQRKGDRQRGGLWNKETNSDTMSELNSAR